MRTLGVWPDGVQTSVLVMVKSGGCLLPMKQKSLAVDQVKELTPPVCSSTPETETADKPKSETADKPKSETARCDQTSTSSQGDVQQHQQQQWTGKTSDDPSESVRHDDVDKTLNKTSSTHAVDRIVNNMLSHQCLLGCIQRGAK